MINKPPGWGYHAAAVITALVIAWWVSVPFGYAESGMVVIFALVPLVLYWAVRLIVALIHDATAVWRRILGWLPLPLIVLVLWAAVDADLPFKTRFALSQSSMERFAGAKQWRSAVVGDAGLLARPMNSHDVVWDFCQMMGSGHSQLLCLW